jgi:hypothetical protein
MLRDAVSRPRASKAARGRNKARGSQRTGRRVAEPAVADPLTVRPAFLKPAKRAEALVCLLPLAPHAYQVLKCRYRQTAGEA